MPPVGIAIAQFAAAAASVVGINVVNAAFALAGSLLVNAVAQRLLRRSGPSPQQVRFDLLQPSTRPVKRFVYGRKRAPATPVRRWVVGNRMYQLTILNSRPSAVTGFTVYFDGRASEIVSGNAFDFAGSGARLRITENFPDFGFAPQRPRIWIGRGNQVSPPAELLTLLPDDLLSTDAFAGQTVMWVEMNAGRNEERFDRWPNGTRTEIEVEADWSLVCDPRDPAQDFDDPSTWQWSDNQALCLLDAILQNPIRRWPRFLMNMQSFIDGANLADQSVPLKADGTVNRYTTNGILVWNGAEIMDQVQPIAEAGAGEIVKIGGQVTYSNGAARATDYTITDILDGQGFSFNRLRPSSDLPVAVRASYINPDRDWQESELPALAVGAGGLSLGDDGIAGLPLNFVTEPTQAMRVQKIVRNRVAAQKRITCMLPPDAIQLVPGSVCEWGIAEIPYAAGRWRVEEINPHVWLSDNDGVSMRCAVSLAQEPDDLDAWSPAVDEFDLATEEYIPPAPVRVAPSDLQATTGPGVASGTTARIRFSFLPVTGNVIGYEWQWREVGGSYAEGGTINADVRDTSDRVFGFLVPVEPGVEYQIRVRTLYFGPISGWTPAIVITAQGPEFALDPPVNGQAVGGGGQIVVSFQAPNNASFEGIEFWANDADDLSTAALIEGPFFGSANATFEITESGLGDDVTRFYWTRSVGPFGSVSDFSDSVSATTDP